MANEATLIFETGPQIPFTVADGTAITKGTILKLTTPMTAIITSAAQDAIAGIAGTDKIANDGVTKLGVYREGIFKVYCSGSVTVGDALAASGVGSANWVYKAPVNTSGTQILGYALESATAGTTFLMELNIGTGGSA